VPLFLAIVIVVPIAGALPPPAAEKQMTHSTQ